MGSQAVSKSSILKKCRKLFKENGYSNTSITMLAEACELSKSHFYYYFRNKEALMEAILRSELSYFEDEVFQIAYEEAFSPRKRLKKIFKQLDANFCKGSEGSLIVITLFNSSSEEREIFFPIIKSYYEAWEKALFTIYSAAVSHKKSRKYTQATLLKIEGSLIFLAVNKDPLVFREACAEVLREFKKL